VSGTEWRSTGREEEQTEWGGGEPGGALFVFKRDFGLFVVKI
jgi:hypothetical protein